MKTTKLVLLTGISILLLTVMLVSSCGTDSNLSQKLADKDSLFAITGSFNSKTEWGEHLVNTLGCHDCHSPKKMTEQGPVPDPELLLSGHHADFRPLDFDRSIVEINGWGMSNEHMTAWAGPWGISYAANITSDETGIGNWSEDSFKRAIREGKFKGLESGRPLLPPMPWFNYVHLSDGEVSAIFSYLKNTKPVKNIAPDPVPPSTMM